MGSIYMTETVAKDFDMSETDILDVRQEFSPTILFVQMLSCRNWQSELIILVITTVNNLQIEWSRTFVTQYALA